MISDSNEKVNTIEDLYKGYIHELGQTRSGLIYGYVPKNNKNVRKNKKEYTDLIEPTNIKLKKHELINIKKKSDSKEKNYQLIKEESSLFTRGTIICTTIFIIGFLSLLYPSHFDCGKSYNPLISYFWNLTVTYS
jgi:hypothetical protein